MKLLYVEDDIVDQIAVERLIQQAQLPFQMVAAKTISEAISLTKDNEFDVILSDYLLGSKTALDLLEAVTDIPVVVITGHGSEDIAVQAMKSGAYDYIVKDVQNDYLKILPIVLTNTVKRKIAEKQAIKAQKEYTRRQVLQQFIHDASHDLRTLLTTLDVSLHLLDKYIAQLTELLVDAPEAIQESLKNVNHRRKLSQQNNEKIKKLIINMLDLIRLDNVEHLELKPCDINELASNIVADYQQRAEEEGKLLQFSPHAEPLLFRAEPDQFLRVIEQLVKNAFDFSSAGDEVRISTMMVENNIILTVSDTGYGIPEEHLDKIFQRFYRGDQARTLDKENSGLGLAFVARLVELHHGTIEVNSMVGHGSVFRVFLPKLE